MKECIFSVFQIIGFAFVLSTLLITIKIVFNKYVRGLWCNHKYIVKGQLKQGERNVLFVECEKCKRKKDIELYDDLFRIQLESENKNE